MNHLTSVVVDNAHSDDSDAEARDPHVQHSVVDPHVISNIIQTHSAVFREEVHSKQLEETASGELRLTRRVQIRFPRKHKKKI